MGFDEYWTSPIFSPSPSPSPSPPIYTSKHIQSKVLLRCESAPVSIPANKPFNKQNLPPSPSAKLTRAATLKSDKSTGASGSSVEKFSIGRDESGRFSGVRLSSTSSPRISYSRSSSRMSIQDDFDDSEFACPFVVDDDDMLDPGSRPESYDQKGQPNNPLEPGGSFPVRKSQDAAVGALVLMLKKAPPLRQDLLLYSKPANCINNEQLLVQKLEDDQQQLQKKGSTSSSMFSISKTTADALEELRSYKEMKELLLSQGNKKSFVFKESSSSGEENSGERESPDDI